jgi:ATP-dependent RNA helicase SUPV3L1/SUV3
LRAGGGDATLPVEMAIFPSVPARPSADHRVKAVLGPTNTGKTHLAIERLCAHSSGAIGFPLRLLAREVYDRVCAIKGENRVALITGEERIEPKDARYLLCTVEAMPMDRDMAFVAIDEAQLAADRERGHVFTDRMLNARGREETMILGSATLEPMIKALVPEAEIVSRPRFSTLSHIGATKLSRVPPRSAIVAFSAEQVYAIAEMLRRFRGGAAVVMGALSPQTRNAQVALYQSGEVDYLVATDAIGMGLNLDIGHVAFAGLSKFDGVRQRRLTTAEMAQIAGRAGRHQRDGTFGTLAGTGSHDATFADEEIFAIEEHRFPPLSRLFWRDAEPRFDSLGMLIADLEAPPMSPQLAAAAEAIDLTVVKRLAEDPAIAGTGSGKPAACPTSGSRGPKPIRVSSRVCGKTCATAHWAAITSPGRSPNSTILRAISTPCNIASPRSDHGPTSPSGPTGCLPRRRWQRGPGPSKRGFQTRCTPA